MARDCHLVKLYDHECAPVAAIARSEYKQAFLSPRWENGRWPVTATVGEVNRQ